MTTDAAGSAGFLLSASGPQGSEVRGRIRPGGVEKRPDGFFRVKFKMAGSSLRSTGPRGVEDESESHEGS